MYRIDTGQARTDLYGIGKGGAQVIDLSPLREQAAQDRKENFVRKQQEAKDSEDRVNDIATDVNGLNKLAVLDRERPMFAQRQAEVYDYVKSNIGKIKSGDTNALLAVKQKINSLYTDAEQSKNTREQLEKYSNEMLTKGMDKYRKQSTDYLNDFISNPEHNGNYSFDPGKINERYDLVSYINKDLVDYAHQQAPNNRGYKTNTPEQRKQMITEAITSDPIKLQAANDLYDQATDKLGASDPIEYAARKYEKNLLVNDKPQLSEWEVNGGGDKAKAPKVNGRFVDYDNGKSRFQFEYANTSETPTLTVKDPKSKGATVQVKPLAVNYDGDHARLEVTTVPEAGSDEKGHTIELDYQQTADIMKNKYGIDNVFKLKHHMNPESANVTYDSGTGSAKASGDTQADWNKKWTALKPGEKMVGPDGKTYIKK